MKLSNKALITLVVAGTEVAFGLIEGLALPNIFERKKGDPFFIPGKKQILETTGTLLVTGILSGLAAEYVLTKYKVSEKNRVWVIAIVSILINMAEAVIVPNISGKEGLLKSGKVYIPGMRIFVSSLAFLSLTAVLGGFVSDRILVAVAPEGTGGEGGSVLEPVPTPTLASMPTPATNGQSATL